MFTTLKYRRPLAVLAAVALMAGMLAAAPAAADEHPEQDYLPTFSACDGSPASGFEDVPEGHSSAGSIDCIAYYGITKGTSATTYSPLMSVSREHMALFLTRLAGLVGIEMASDPDDAGFTDIGDLSDGSQTAINQLADLGITQGTSATTYSPDAAVTRGHMALFITRLMDQMDPFADPNAAEGAAAFAYIPKQVVAVADDDSTPADETKALLSPFTDLGSVTKSAYDAIVALWELGVASGISDTAYGPSALITRAAMADFMAGVLDHSNARPAGVSAQVNKTTDFGSVEATLVLSVRGDNFAPMGDVSVKTFTATESGGIDEDTGKCLADTDPCDWNDNEDITNDDGNNFQTISEDTDTGNVESSETWYAWMGDEDNDEFVKGESGEAMVTLTAKADALGIRVTSDINENATTNQVDIGKDRSVVITAQLVDEASDSTTIADADAVAKEGVTISISTFTQGGTNVFPLPDNLETDADGKVMFTIEGPADPDDNTTVSRDDALTFSGDVDGDGTADTPDNETGTITVQWRNADAVVNNGTAKTNAGYVIIDDDKVRIAVTVSYYDQYGNPAGSGSRLTITINNTDDTDTETGQASSGANMARVRSNGTARFTASLDADAGDTFEVAVTELGTVDDQGTFTALSPTVDAPDLTAANGNAVLAVRHAHKNDDGVSATRDTAGTNQVIVDADNDRFIIDTGDGTSNTIAGVLYSYESSDTFILDDNEVDMDKFEEAIAENNHVVTVVFYRADGNSIFSVE